MLKLYGLDIRVLQEKELSAYWMHRMPPERLEKIARIKGAQDRARSLGAGILLSYGMQAEGLTVKAANIQYAGHGKPYTVNYPNIQFNLSHADNYVVAAFAIKERSQTVEELEYGELEHEELEPEGLEDICMNQIGIDIERIRVYKDSLIHKCCTSAEEEWLHAQPDRMEAMTRIWTAKESYIKYCGEGLRIPLKDLETDFGAGLIHDRHEEGVAYLLESQIENCIIHVCGNVALPQTELQLLSREELLNNDILHI